jgi:hypothetical protein
MFHSNDLVSRNHASHPATLARIIHFFSPLCLNRKFV